MPISTDTEPSGLITVRHWLAWPTAAPGRPADAQAALDGPVPILAARLPELLPLGQFRGLVQLVAIERRRARRGAYCALILKTSSGSMPILAAKSSIAQQVRNDACWLPGARQARCVPVLVETGVRVHPHVRDLRQDVRLRRGVHRRRSRPWPT